MNWHDFMGTRGDPGGRDGDDASKSPPAAPAPPPAPAVRPSGRDNRGRFVKGGAGGPGRPRGSRAVRRVLDALTANLRAGKLPSLEGYIRQIARDEVEKRMEMEREGRCTADEYLAKHGLRRMEPQQPGRHGDGR